MSRNVFIYLDLSDFSCDFSTILIMTLKILICVIYHFAFLAKVFAEYPTIHCDGVISMNYLVEYDGFVNLFHRLISKAS